MFFCSSQGGIQNICRDIGFGDNFEIRLSREHKGANGAILYAINTDFHVSLELPAILNGDDKLQSMLIINSLLLYMTVESKVVHHHAWISGIILMNNVDCVTVYLTDLT